MMIFILIPVLIFFLDYKVKSYVETHKKEGLPETKLRGLITVRRLSNKGAAASFLDEKPKTVTWISGMLLLVLSITYVGYVMKKCSSWLKVFYGFILGGGLSNFYDRIKKGAVTDYFSFNVPWKWLKRLVFNISDMFIIFGSVLSMIFHMKGSK